MNPQQIGIFFDVDDTLYDHLQPLFEALQQVIPQQQESLSYSDVYQRFRYYSEVLVSPQNPQALPLEEMRYQRFILTLKEFEIEITEEQAKQMQAVYIGSQYNIRPYDGVVELIHELMDQGYTVGLLTNGPAEHQWKKICALHMDQVFARDRIFISGEVGLEKPDPAIFNYVNRLTDTTPEHSFFIGDSWRNDVVGAVSAHWHMIWFNARHAVRESNHQPDTEAVNYTEIRTQLLAMIAKQFDSSSID